MTPAPEVRAAGGIVARDTPAGTHILLVHRPRYDDWTFPKGKLEKGESWEEGALREVEEETGLTCVLGPRLGETDYLDHKSRRKRVVYFSLTPIDPLSAESFEPNDEVDEICWLSASAAEPVLTYERDRAFLRDLMTRPSAGYHGDDALRSS